MDQTQTQWASSSRNPGQIRSPRIDPMSEVISTLGIIQIRYQINAGCIVLRTVKGTGMMGITLLYHIHIHTAPDTKNAFISIRDFIPEGTRISFIIASVHMTFFIYSRPDLHAEISISRQAPRFELGSCRDCYFLDQITAHDRNSQIAHTILPGPLRSADNLKSKVYSTSL